MNQENFDRVERLKPIASELDCTLAQLAIAWTLRAEGVASAIVGASTIEQVNENRGIVGTTSASLSRRVEGIEDEVLAARSRLSEIEDLDFAAAITEFTQLQTALEASMLTGSRLLSLSFLDFLR